MDGDYAIPTQAEARSSSGRGGAGAALTPQDEVKRLRRELRVCREELTGRRLAITDLKKEIERMKDESISLKEARKITYKALRKGRALQFLSHMFSHASVYFDLKRESFAVLAKHAFGEGPYLYRFGQGGDRLTSRPSIRAPYSDSQLMLLRQEQLVLLAENERLATQVKALETSFRGGEFSTPTQHWAAGSGPRPDTAFLRLGSRQHGTSPYKDGDDSSGIEVDIDMAKRVVAGAVCSLTIARSRSLFSAWLALSNNKAFKNGSIKQSKEIMAMLERQFPMCYSLQSVYTYRLRSFKMWALHKLHCHAMRVSFKEREEDNDAGMGLDMSPTPRARLSASRHGGGGGNFPYSQPYTHLEQRIPNPSHTITHAYVHQPAYFHQLPSQAAPANRSVFVPKVLPPPSASEVRDYDVVPSVDAPYFRPSTATLRTGVGSGTQAGASGGGGDWEDNRGGLNRRMVPSAEHRTDPPSRGRAVSAPPTRDPAESPTASVSLNPMDPRPSTTKPQQDIDKAQRQLQEALKANSRVGDDTPSPFVRSERRKR